MASHDKTAESYKNAIAKAASLAASAMLFRSVVSDLLPYEMRGFVNAGLGQLRSRMSSQHTIVIEETEGYANNQIYDAARTYLATRINTDMQRLRVSRVDERKSMMIGMETGEEMTDVFDGTEFKWQLFTHENKSSNNSNGNNYRTYEVRSFELSFHKKHKEKALKAYLPFILETAKTIRNQDRTLKIYMNEGDSWFAIDLHHPSTFETLAMEEEVKRSTMDDLAQFVKRKDYYKKIGRAWKRGYLLYGPPGTGKSSLIAAMANYLKFDIYDLELTEVRWNSTLRRLLIGMTNKSILVIEDIDCTNLHKRDEGEDQESHNSKDDKVTLSGLLNFVDGLWSTSGEERIIVFTTNYKERLDPALLRPGRMDLHIPMGYCTPEAFRILASNYHDIDSHVTFPEIEQLIREVVVTPAEVAEVLMRSDDTDLVLKALVGFLKGKRKDAEESKNVKEEVKEKGRDDGEN